jgi:hypothetical protein
LTIGPCFFLHKGGKVIEIVGPEALVAVEPIHRLLHRFAVSRHATTRPVFSRAMRPASVSTSRCFMIAGSDIAKGCASSLTESVSRSESRATSARRVGSASAAKVRSRA